MVHTVTSMVVSLTFALEAQQPNHRVTAQLEQ